MKYKLFLLGMILAAQSFMYTISRFIMSWASDHFPVKIMFAGGMFLTGFVMLAFSGISYYSLSTQPRGYYCIVLYYVGVV